MKLSVQVRTATGKQVKKVRKAGLLPAVVYGKSLDNAVLLSCGRNDFIKVYNQCGYSTPIELSGWFDHLVLLQDIQVDPVSDEVLTVDFLAVSRDEKVSAAVPVILIGESKVEKLNEGSVQLVKDTVEVEAFPQDLPHSIEIDITKIETLNDVIFVKDLDLGSKVEVLDDGEQALVTVVELSDEEEEVLVVEGEGEEWASEDGEAPAEAEEASEK